jgi:hypothetical protein
VIAWRSCTLSVAAQALCDFVVKRRPMSDV